MSVGAHRRVSVSDAQAALLIAGLCVALAGCNALWGIDGLSFDGSAAGGSPSGGGPAGGSGGIGGSGGAGGGGATGGAAGAGGSAGAPPSFCAGTALVACYEFQGDASDGSGNGHDASAQDVAYVPAPEGLAIELDAASLVTIPPSPSFGVSELTVEAWVRLAELPATGTRMGIVDRNARWGFWIHDAGLRCSASGSADLSGPQIPLGQWTHVACTIDATARTIYVDGVVVASTTGASLDVSPTGDPLTIGSDYPSGDPLVGRLDQLRIFGLARSATQICEAAGGSGC